MSFIVGSSFIIFSVATLSASAQTGARPQAQQTIRKAPSSQTRPLPYSMETLLKLIKDSKGANPIVSIKGVINGVKQRGVDFAPTPEQLDQLRTESGSEELITVIKEKAGIPETTPATAAPTEPPKPKEGRLTVTCKPVDCVVLVNTKPIGSTKKGELPGLTLPEGKITVAASSENFIPDKEGQVVEITDGGSVAVDFVFKLSPVALQARGGQLLEGMVQALGGDAGLRESQFLKAVGTLTVYSAGPQKLWPLTAFIQLPANARFDITKANESYIIIHTESGYDLSRSKSKNLKGPELEELEDALRRVQENQISKIVDRLRGSGGRAMADKVASAPGEEAVLRIEQGPDIYVVTLGVDSRPKEIRLESSGLNSGLKVLLSEYNKVGNAVIPHKTQVILPGTPSRGVVAQFETVVVNPPGADFAIKKGNRLMGR